MNKHFVAADDLLRDSFQLAANIAEAGFHPDFLVGLWRGGSAVGIAVQEGLDFLGIKTDHIAIRTSYRGAPSYTEMVNKADTIRVHGLQYLLENLFPLVIQAQNNIKLLRRISNASPMSEVRNVSSRRTYLSSDVFSP